MIKQLSRQWWLPGLIALVVMFSACSSSKSAGGNSLLNNQQFARKAAKENVILLDVRTAEEYQTGHLKNAQLLDYTNGDFTVQLPKLDLQKTYLLYCRSGKRSDKAASDMKAAGFKKVYQLKNGIIAWNGELEKE